eukprot:jgi/Tetstr1/447310/TSEL_034747.t1
MVALNRAPAPPQPVVTTATHELVWNNFCTKLYDCIPGICNALYLEGSMSPIDELLELVLDDILENPDPYDDMLYSCLTRVNSRGYTQNPRHGTRTPGFAPFPEELKERAVTLLERGNIDSYDIIEVFQDVVEHYLGWCKEIITVYWSSSELSVFQFLLGACSRDFYSPTPRIAKATVFDGIDAETKCPFPIPSRGLVDIVVHSY